VFGGYTTGEDLDSSGVRLVNVFKIRREREHERFTQTVFNTRYLFHGSRMGSCPAPLSCLARHTSAL
jgi:hypothetical protein